MTLTADQKTVKQCLSHNFGMSGAHTRIFERPTEFQINVIRICSQNTVHRRMTRFLSRRDVHARKARRVVRDPLTMLPSMSSDSCSIRKAGSGMRFLTRILAVGGTQGEKNDQRHKRSAGLKHTTHRRRSDETQANVTNCRRCNGGARCQYQARRCSR